MEAKIEGKGTSTKLVAHKSGGTSKYSRYLKGAVPRKKTLNAVKAKYDGENGNLKSNLLYWAYHPIAIFLLEEKLSCEQIIRTLEWLPEGDARKLIWDEHGIQRREIPDSAELADALAALQSIEGLTAILGKLRLRYLIGQTEDLDLYETALLDCFPEVLARSTHLSIARYSLMQALADFLDWQCGWVLVGRQAEVTLEDRTEEFWSSLWRRFEAASAKNATTHVLMLDSALILRQKDIEDLLEIGGESR
jgi:hypothetical protein